MARLKNFISDFEDYLIDTESPKIFRTWGAIACIAGALERRVWVHNRKVSLTGKIYPTQGVFHIAPTGVGKAPSVKLCQHLWDSTDSLNIGTESMTAASFYDELIMSGTLGEDNEMIHPLSIATEEISSFFIEYDPQLLGVMLKAIDCSKKIDQSRRSLKEKKLIIPYPSLTCLFAGQPIQLNRKFPEDAYSLGFMGRCHIVYSDEAITVPFFSDSNDLNPRALENLEDQIEIITTMNGEVTFTNGARSFISNQQLKRKEIQAPHPRLEGYYERRVVHLTKLAMIKCISMGRMEITTEDLDWSLNLMELTEIDSPKAFQSTKQDEDTLLLQNFLSDLKNKNKTTIREKDIQRYLEQYVEHWKIPVLQASLIRAEYLIPINGSPKTFKVAGSDLQPVEKITQIK